MKLTKMAKGVMNARMENVSYGFEHLLEAGPFIRHVVGIPYDQDEFYARIDKLAIALKQQASGELGLILAGAATFTKGERKRMRRALHKDRSRSVAADLRGNAAECLENARRFDASNTLDWLDEAKASRERAAKHGFYLP